MSTACNVNHSHASLGDMTKPQALTAIAKHAKAEGLSIRALCALAGVDYVTFYRWQTSRTTPREKTVQALLSTTRAVAVK